MLLSDTLITHLFYRLSARLQLASSHQAMMKKEIEVLLPDPLMPTIFYSLHSKNDPTADWLTYKLFPNLSDYPKDRPTNC